PDRHEEVDTLTAGQLQTDLDMARGRVFLDAIKEERLQTRFMQGGQGPLGMASGLETWIRHQQHAAAAQFPRQLTKACQGAGAENHPGEGMIIECWQRPGRLARAGAAGGGG